ncbi:MAG: ADP-ribosylation factor-like protein [Candidatus Helarchaeota archaeon]
MSEIYKVVFLGLDYAGKTSILKILEGSYSDLDQIKPTLGRSRTEWNILGFKIMNWDLGGQKQYRDEYFATKASKQQILQDTNLLIYVVDIQDVNRFEEAVSYFNKVLQALSIFKIRCPVILCIHKTDPNIIDTPRIKENLEKVEDLFSEASSKYGLEIKVFITSIYDQKSLIEMFSEGIQQLLPVGVLNQLLESYREEAGILGTILFDMNFFVIGDSFADLHTKKTAYKTINAFVILMRDFKGIYDDQRQINFDLNVLDGFNYKFHLHKITKLTSPYYLLIMGLPSINPKNLFVLFEKSFIPKIEQALHDLIKLID